jgi:hypothetical protein
VRSLQLITSFVVAAIIGFPPPALADPSPVGARVDLRILVVGRPGSAANAIADHLALEGIPFDVIDLGNASRPTVDAAFLAGEVDGVPRAKYQAVVLPDARPFEDPAEATALADYERQYGIAQLDAFTWPSSVVGLESPTYAGSLDGVTATVTDAGRAGAFGYLRGPVPFEDNDPIVGESYGYLSQARPADPNSGSTFIPLLTAPVPGDPSAPAGVLAGEYTVDGRREMVLTFAYNSYQEQFRLLAPGIVEWLTGGVHLGYFRNYFSMHIDDVFMPDSRWSVEGNCTPGDDCTGPFVTNDIRMTPTDVAYLVQWQASSGLPIDLLFNAAGSVEAAGAGTDPLTEALLAVRNDFRWTNHTYAHAFLGCLQDFTVRPWQCATDPITGAIRYLPQAGIQAEVTENLAWADAKGLALDPSALVTGEHSGLRILPQQPLDSPFFAPALSATGVGWLGSDDSRDPAQRAVGAALTVPRHPVNVFYNVATTAEEVDEYNWIYTSRANGGSGICEDYPETTTCIAPLPAATGYQSTIVPLETSIALSHILSNDPRPHYAHQSNLAEGRVLYPLLDSMLARYRAAFADNAPIVSPSLADAGRVLQAQAAWRTAAGSVTAYIRDGVVTLIAADGLEVPLTVPDGTHIDSESGPLYGAPYAGARSGYWRANGGPTLLVLP